MKKMGVFMAAFFSSIQGLNQWYSPENNLRYNEVCFLTSHNSYAAKKHGYYYAQQQGTLKEQLEFGVRGLMLDTFLDGAGNVILCHGGELLTKCMRGGKPSVFLPAELASVLDFLKKEPTEVVTIFLENYVKDGIAIDKAFKMAGLENFILKPTDWDAPEHGGWPTIEWMQKSNKRLVIFNSIKKTELTFNQWEHVVENQWGTTNPKRACRERKESLHWRSQSRYIYVVNFFPSFRLNFGNSYTQINTKQLDAFMKTVLNGLGNGFAKDRLPNFLSLDFINEGDPMKHINKINLATENRKLYFRPLKG